MNYFKKGKGFTLIEVVIALAIFGMLIGGLLGFLPWGVEGVGKVKDRSTAHALVDAVQIELERLGFSYVEEATRRLDGLYSTTGNPEDAAYLHELCLVAPRHGRIVSVEGVRAREQQRNQSTDKLILSLSTSNISESYRSMGGSVKFDRYKGEVISLRSFGESSEDKESIAANRWINEGDRYFLVICRQFAKFPDGEFAQPSRHAHNISNGYLALQIEVQWPYKVPGSSSEGDFIEVEERFRSKFEFPLAISR